MLMREERELIVEIGKQMSSSGLCPGTSGNQSIYNPELGLMAVKACGDGNAVLLANHGIIVCGKNLKSAFGLAETLEYVAELQYRAMCIGKPNVLSHEQMAEVFEAFKSYGQPGTKKTAH